MIDLQKGIVDAPTVHPTREIVERSANSIERIFPKLGETTLLALDNPVRRSFVNEMVPTDEIPNAVTLYSAMNSMARIAGPAIAGLLIVTVGYGW